MKPRVAAYACCEGSRIPLFMVSRWMSFYNSPYPAHRCTAAIDLYFDEEEALYPFEEGVVASVRRLSCGDNVVLVFMPRYNCIAKLLHLEPRLRVGEKVYLGDPLGKPLQSSPFFYSWTEPHVHVEVRPLHDPLRARGAFTLLPYELPRVKAGFLGEVVVKSVHEHYVLVEPVNSMVEHYTPVVTSVGGELAAIEGGVPYYGYSALLLDTSVPGARSLGSVHVLLREHGPPIDQSVKPKARMLGFGAYIGRSAFKIIVDPRALNVKEGDIVDCRELMIRNRCFRQGESNCKGH